VINEPIMGYGLRSGQRYGFGEKGKKEIVVPLDNRNGHAESASRPLKIHLDLGEDLRYYVEGIIDDTDEFKAGIGRLSRRG
jgi:hypothetical protein